MRTKLKPNEKIILKSQQHWFVIASPIIWTLLFLLFSSKNTLILYSPGLTFLMLSGFPFFLALAGLFGVISLYKIIYRSTNIWLVTNLRIIDEQGVFSVSSKETPLDKINNVAYKKSFLGRIFDYGNVQIQSASERGSTIHKMIENPKKLRDVITSQQEKYKQTQSKSKYRFQ